MRALLQRVSSAHVTISDETIGQIDNGYLILLGVEPTDGSEDIDWLVRKIIGLRLFSDPEGKMNLNLTEAGGRALVVSQFTLHASCKKGNRPSFTRAAHPDHAEPTYEAFCQSLSQSLGQAVATGKFGGDMQVHLINDGPVTLLLDSRNRDF